MILYKASDLKRALLICSLVGTWLVILNQGSEILGMNFNSLLLARIFLDYATPFAVSSLTGVLRNRSDLTQKKRTPT